MNIIMEPPQLELFSTLVYLGLIFFSVIMSVMGSIWIITFLTRRQIDVKIEIIKNRNIGIALVLGSFIWTIGRMCIETLKPIMNAFYGTYASGFNASNFSFFMLVVFASLFISVMIGAITVYLSIKVLLIINKDINEWEEIKQGNIAVALIISITILVVGAFFETINSYIVLNIINL